MKMQKAVIFVKKNLKMNMPEIKNYCKVWGHRICNLKHSVPKKFPWLFTIDLTMINILSEKS